MNTNYNEWYQIPQTKAERDWIAERLSTLSAKESIILAAARERLRPETAADVINMLATLRDYSVFCPAVGCEGLGKFYLAEANLKLPEMVLAHINMEALGIAFEDSHPGLFVGDCYVAYPSKPEQKPYDGTNLDILKDTGWSVKLKLASSIKPEGIWLRLPDQNFGCADSPDEIDFALRGLGVMSIEACTLLDARCIFPEAGNLMEQYDNPAALIHDGNDLGLLLNERAQGMRDYERKLAVAIAYENCRTLKDVIACAENIGQYSFIMSNRLTEYARSELLKAGAPEMLIDSDVFDLDGFAVESLEKSGYRPDRTKSVYIKPLSQEQEMEANARITRHSDSIKIEGHSGTWYVIEEASCRPDAEPAQPLKPCYLLEHEKYGDEAANLIVDEDGNILLDDVWNGFQDLAEAGWTVQPVERQEQDTLSMQQM